MRSGGGGGGGWRRKYEEVLDEEGPFHIAQSPTPTVTSNTSPTAMISSRKTQIKQTEAQFIPGTSYHGLCVYMKPWWSSRGQTSSV